MVREVLFRNGLTGNISNCVSQRRSHSGGVSRSTLKSARRHSVRCSGCRSLSSLLKLINCDRLRLSISAVALVVCLFFNVFEISNGVGLKHTLIIGFGDSNAVCMV